MKTKIMRSGVIVTNMYDDIEDFREWFEEFCEINGLDKDEEDIYEWVEKRLQWDFEDEEENLNIPCEGDILCIADLGLWDGRHSAYQIIPNATKFSDIFRVSMKNIDNYKFHYDRYNVMAELHHHDGCNNIEFRLIKKGVNPQPLLDAIYNQEEVTREMIRRYTTSLRPYIKKCYGC